MGHNYDDWPKERLISHLRKLENTLRNARATQLLAIEPDQSLSGPSHAPTSTSGRKEFKFSDHPTRKIALRFTYDGMYYNGLEHQKDVTPLPTVEETLWDALVKTRLVDPEGDFDSHGWEKCGRTDRGVSAAGQVISFWVRCKERGHPQREPLQHQAGIEEDPGDPVVTRDATSSNVLAVPGDIEEIDGELDDVLAAMSGWDEPPTNNTLPASLQTSNASDAGAAREFNYVTLLNNVLPSSLRVLSWSAVEPSFSARFNCLSRHYKYFFVTRGLDTEAMSEGAKRLVGEHDWRNLCKVDPSKFRLDAEGEERWSFRRVVKLAEVNPVYPQCDNAHHRDNRDELYVFDLVGTAFLYNQVRHIMAILFLIGSGLEDPSVVTALLNVDASKPGPTDTAITPIVSAKPTYQMADALPLVLWDCQYDPNDVHWVGDSLRNSDTSVGSCVQENASDVNGLYAELRTVQERSYVHSALHSHFLKAAARFHRSPREFLPISNAALPGIPSGTTLAIPLGGGAYRNTRIAGGKGYVKLLDRKRLDEVEVTWERWKSGKGAKQGNREALQAAAAE